MPSPRPQHNAAPKTLDAVLGCLEDSTVDWTSELSTDSTSGLSSRTSDRSARTAQIDQTDLSAQTSDLSVDPSAQSSDPSVLSVDLLSDSAASSTSDLNVDSLTNSTADLAASELGIQVIDHPGPPSPRFHSRKPVSRNEGMSQLNHPPRSARRVRGSAFRGEAARRQRGLTLIETVVAFAILLLALVGVIQLILVSSRSTQFAHRVAAASAVAHDLLENMSLWAYDDPRLVPKETLSTADGETAVTDFGFGRGKEVAEGDQPHYGEHNDGIAQEGAALYDENRRYQGIELESSGLPEFSRYWNVYALDPVGDGIEEGKLILVGVRWFEDGVGYRHVTASSFRSNDRIFSQ